MWIHSFIHSKMKYVVASVFAVIAFLVILQPFLRSSDLIVTDVLSHPLNTFYGFTDLLWFKEWSHRSTSRLPTVLIYTWGTEDTFKMFVNEIYWKACYAHAHGFDIVFAEDLNVKGLKQFQYTDDKFMTKWYSEEMMWAWHPDIGRFLFSGKYDYVFNVGADVLFNSKYMDFPVWAYDAGHDVIIMDQDYVGWGLNQNSILLKPTSFTKQFLDADYEYRAEFWTQGDNGAWMENILVFLGRENEEAGRPGYNNSCAKFGILPMPQPVLNEKNFTLALYLGFSFCKCFFQEFDRLAGSFGHRKSKHIGFTKTFAVSVSNISNDSNVSNVSTVSTAWNEGKILPEESTGFGPSRVKPWANCFDHVRLHWTQPDANCFAFHWNGEKKGSQHSVVKGKCPDPTFDWKKSPWNYVNRGKGHSS